MERRKIHFVGIGGVGMAGLAHIVLDMGWRVTGSDIAESEMSAGLAARGVPVQLGHPDKLPDGTEVLVYSSAVPPEDPERRCAAELGIPEYRRGDFLNLIAAEFEVRVAISGSHGKTTTSAMVAHILRSCGLNPGYLVGGSVNGFPRAAAFGAGKILVSEVDESDGSQAGFPATIAVVLNIDDDHSWSLGGEQALEDCFTALCSGAEHIICRESEIICRLFGGRDNAQILNDEIPAEALPGFFGWHSRQNAATALAVAEKLGVDRRRGLESLRSFGGVCRRMDIRGCSTDGRFTLVEDYAHHPTELRAALDAIREEFPGHRLYAVFQPHRIERVQRYGALFAQQLSGTDFCCVVEPFGAWRTDGKTADVTADLMDRITAPCVYLPNVPEKIAEVMSGKLQREAGKAVLAVIGAGDVHKIIPALLRILNTVQEQ